MKDSKIIVTIFGADKIGIVAAISQVMEKYEVNIEDISQTTMQEYFVEVAKQTKQYNIKYLKLSSYYI